MKMEDMFNLEAIESKEFDLENDEDAKACNALDHALWCCGVQCFTMTNPKSNIKRFFFNVKKSHIVATENL